MWMDYKIEGAGHIRCYTAKILKRQLNQHGLRVISHKGNFIPLLPQIILNDVNFPLLRFTGNLYPNLSQGIILKARKPVKHVEI